MLLAPLSDAARVWFFPLVRSLTEAEARALLGRVEAWLPTWASHGRPVAASATLDDRRRVLIVAAEISPDALNAGVSGCGIDAMTHAVEAALEAEGLAQLPALNVIYEGEGGVWESASRPQFRALVRAGQAGPQTRVLDLTATTLGEVRRDGVEKDVAESWHARVFRVPAAA